MGSRVGQYCRCGTRLAADNPGYQCARCERASRDKLIAPPEVPAEFWQTEQFRDAFAAQHMGWVARAYCTHPHHHAAYGPGGISQGLLGQWLGLSQPQVSRIENGSPIRNLDTLAYWARVLRIPPELLWFDLLKQNNGGLQHPDDAHGRGMPGSALSLGQAGARLITSSLLVFLDSYYSNLGPLLQVAGEDGEDGMERREFLLLQAVAFAGLGIGSTASTLGLEVVRRELNHLIVDERVTADVDEWQEIALDYGQTYPVTEAATLLQALIVDLYSLQLAIRRQPDETAQRQLLQAGALLAAFTAQTVANLGDLLEARRWWRTARSVADEAGDPYTMFWVRGREVVRAGYERRPVRVILQLVKEIEERLDEAPPEVLPQFFSGKAQTLGARGAARRSRANFMPGA